MPAAPLPDAAQQAIIDSYVRGSLSIIAVPGAGKSTMLINLACKLIESGCPPERILMTTFTEKAAADLASRLEDTIAERGIASSAIGRPSVQTLHSLGAKILTDDTNPLDVGLPFEPVLWDEAVQIGHTIDICLTLADKLEAICLPDQSPDADQTQWSDLARSLIAAIGHCRELGLEPKQVRRMADNAEKGDRRLLLELSRVYQLLNERKRDAGAIDYADQILLPLRLLEVNETAERWQGSFDYIIEDECQDSSVAQFRLLNKLAERCGNLIRVGDPLQSIYAWRDAFVEGIHIHHQQAEHRHSLVTNYRSARSIIDLANFWKNRWHADSVMMVPRVDAPEGIVTRRFFASETDEAASIADTIHNLLVEWPTASVAILTRTTRQLSTIASALAQARIYFRNPAAGDFFQSEVIRTWFHAAALVDSLLARPFAGLQAQRAARHAQQLAAVKVQQSEQLTTVLRRLQDCVRATDFLDAIAQLRSSPSLQALHRDFLDELRNRLLNALGYALGQRATLTELILSLLSLWMDDTVCEQRDALAKLAAMTKSLEDSDAGLTLTQWLDWLLLQMNYSREAAPQALDPAQPGVVALSTIHSAKGLEWDIVFYPGFNGPSSVWPNLGTSLRVAIDYTSQNISRDEARARQQAIVKAESCRLAYVAMTRARDQLHLSATRGTPFWRALQSWNGPGALVHGS